MNTVFIFTTSFCVQMHPWAFLVLLMCHPWTHMEVELLPVYTPNQEERENPALLATNLQHILADRLAIPVSTT